MYGETLPEIPETEKLPEYWSQLGYAVPGAMGGALPFSWQEIAAFITVTGYDISSNEAKVLMNMSRAYASIIADTNPLSIAPMERQT